jgi:hypothetical protein
MALYPPLWMQEGTYPANLDRWFLQDALGPAPALLSGYGAFQVTQNSTPNMSVNVAPGRALIPGGDVTNQGSYSVWSDAVYNVPIATAPGAGLYRIDTIVLQIQDDFVIGGGNNDFIIVPIVGTPAAVGTETAAPLPNSSVAIAYVVVGPNVTSILTANITDVRPNVRTTTILLPQPLTTGSTIQSFTDLLGDVWVAKNGVNGGAWARARDALHCKLYRNAAWTSATSLTAVAMDTALFDAYGMRAADNIGLSLPVAGMYRIAYTASLTSTASGQWISINVVQNATGVSGANNTNAQASGGDLQATGSDIVRASAGDELKMNVAGLGTYTGGTGPLNTSLSASYVGTG